MIPRSPLGAHLTPGRHGCPDGAAGVTLTERASFAAASIAARGAGMAAHLQAAYGVAPPPRPGRAASGPIALIWTAPGQWLALDESRAGLARFAFARELAAALGGMASVTDLTGARAVLRLSGPAAVEVLRRLVPVDVDEEVFGPNAAALTLASHIGVTLWRVPDAAPTYEIACYRSFAESLADAVLDAAAEFGCNVTPPR